MPIIKRQTLNAGSTGTLLRTWRQRRRLSQLDLSLETEISQRHLSFIESGRATPSREMVLRLAEGLALPLRECNALLLAAGYAPHYVERSLDAVELASARRVVQLVLDAHEPYPALAVDRHWTLLMANRALAPLLEGVDATLLQPPVNVLRVSLHPQGMAPRIANFSQWRAHVLHRLRRQIEQSADAVLVELHRELEAYPVPENLRPRDLAEEPSGSSIAVPMALIVGDRLLSFLSTTTVFGTPTDISLSELAIESFFAADADTAAYCRSWQAQQP